MTFAWERSSSQVFGGLAKPAVPVPVLCEFVWVLRRGYRKSATDVSDAIRRLMRSPNVVMNRTALEAGLSALDAGGDFADGEGGSGFSRHRRVPSSGP